MERSFSSLLFSSQNKCSSLGFLAYQASHFFDHLFGPSLDSLQPVHISFAEPGPKLSTVSQMWPSRHWAAKWDNDLSLLVKSLLMQSSFLLAFPAMAAHCSSTRTPRVPFHRAAPQTSSASASLGGSCGKPHGKPWRNPSKQCPLLALHQLSLILCHRCTDLSSTICPWWIHADFSQLFMPY